MFAPLKKRIAPGISLLLLAGVVSACGGNEPGESQGQSTGGGKQEVTLSVLIDSSNNEQNTRILNEAAQLATKNSEKYSIKVRLDTVPNTDMDKKVDVLAAGSNLPDLVASAPKQVWMKRGLLADLTEWFDRSPMKDDYMYPSLLEEGRNNGKLYSVPIKADSIFLIYNKDLLSKAGIADTGFSSISWDDWIAMLEQIKGAGLKAANGKDVKGFTFRISTYETAPFVFSAGGEFFTQDGSKAVFDSPEAADGLAKLKGLVSSGYADKPETDYANWMSVFFNENAAFTITGGWSLATFEEGGLDLSKLGFSTVPAIQDSTSIFGPGLSFSVFESSAKKEAALELLTALYSSEIYKQWLEITAGIPVLASLSDDPQFAANPIKPVLSEQLNRIKPIHSDNSPSFWTKYDQLLEKIILTDADVSVQQAELQASIQQEIDNNLK